MGARRGTDLAAGLSGWRVAFVLACLIGVGLSAELERIHVGAHVDPGLETVCDLNAGFSCSAVATSPYSVVWGLPLSVWGLLVYAALATLALTRMDEPASWPFGLLLWAGVSATAAGLGLLYVSHAWIGSVCLFCVGTYVVNAMLMLIAAGALRASGLGPMRALLLDGQVVRRRPSLLAGLVILALVVVGLRQGLPRYWEVDLPRGPGGLDVGRTEQGHDWIGAREPVVVVEEFSDYQCPHCVRGHEEARRLLETHPGTVRLVHRHYPLDQACNPFVSRTLHPYACDYSRLAYCAGLQDRFWQANDFLFVHGARPTPVGIRELAEQVGANLERLRECFYEPASKAAVTDDVVAGRALEISGTPTFVVEGVLYPGKPPTELLASRLGAAASSSGSD